MKHPHLIKYYGAAFEGRTYIYIVTELLKGGGTSAAAVVEPSEKGCCMAHTGSSRRATGRQNHPQTMMCFAMTSLCSPYPDLSNLLCKHREVQLPWKLRVRLAWQISQVRYASKLVPFFFQEHHDAVCDLRNSVDTRYLFVCSASKLSSMQAIDHLHEKELIHRDIKTENVLVDSDWRPVLADYGFARKTSAKAMTICGRCF